ncbi:hypothetical protein GPALN_010690 [Globodera pallida]|nr:hypothetical protein GPALN_010690 [Globodera pallida]
MLAVQAAICGVLGPKMQYKANAVLVEPPVCWPFRRIWLLILMLHLANATGLGSNDVSHEKDAGNQIKWWVWTSAAVALILLGAVAVAIWYRFFGRKAATSKTSSPKNKGPSTQTDKALRWGGITVYPWSKRCDRCKF